jgi:CheY-like chemotaxis protein
MASLLYVGQDPRIPTIVDEFFKNRQKDAGEVNSISVAKDEKSFEESLVGISFDLIFMEQLMVGIAPHDWIDKFRKKKPDLKAAIVLVGDERDPVKILKWLEAGFKDYLVMPPDRPILIEKIGLYTTGSRSRDVRQVYSLTMSQQADVAKPGHIEEMSEFDCKVRSLVTYAVEDLVLLYSKAFGADMQNSGSALCRCYKTEAHPGFKGQFLNYFYFVGIAPETLQSIRTSLRKSYVSSKSR